MNISPSSISCDSGVTARWHRKVMGAILTNQRCVPKLAVDSMKSFGGKSNALLSTLTVTGLRGSSSDHFTSWRKLTTMLGLGSIKTTDGKVLREDDLKSILPEGKTNYTVSVEGNIGCGKTTLLEYFRNSPNVEAVQEPVSQWTNIRGHNALALLYQDPKRWSFSFNLYACLTRIQMHSKEHIKPVKMLERSLYSTRYCFVENDYRNKTINGLEYAILDQWFTYLTTKEKTDLDLIVYLRADPSVCYERIKKRSRKEESEVPFELIQNLHDLHEEWLIKRVHKATPNCPVLVLDANREYHKMTRLYEDKRQDILCGYC